MKTLLTEMSKRIPIEEPAGKYQVAVTRNPRLVHVALSAALLMSFLLAACAPGTAESPVAAATPSRAAQTASTSTEAPATAVATETTLPTVAPTERVDWPVCIVPEDFQDCLIKRNEISAYLKYVVELDRSRPFVAKEELPVIVWTYSDDQGPVLLFTKTDNPVNVEKRYYFAVKIVVSQIEHTYFCSVIRFYETEPSANPPYTIVAYSGDDNFLKSVIEFYKGTTYPLITLKPSEQQNLLSASTYKAPDLQQKIDAFVAGDRGAFYGLIFDFIDHNKDNFTF